MEIRPIDMSDIPSALGLSTEAGWNHLPADWERVVKLWPATCLGMFEGGALIATCTLARFNALGWVGTFLVRCDHQRKGLGTKIFDALLKAGREHGATRFALDSSDAGRPIYRKYGFEELEGIERWLGQNTAASEETAALPLVDDDWEELLVFDRSVVCVDRADQLRLLASEQDASVRVLRENGEITAFGFSRPGRLAGSLGPVVAKNAAAAEQVIDALLYHRNRTDGDRGVVMDLLDNDAAKDLMTRKGFKKVRRNIRMFLPLEGESVLAGPCVYAATALGMG